MAKKTRSSSRKVSEKESVSTTYRPSRKIMDIRNGVYADILDMLEEKDRTWPQFNGEDGDRTLKQYVDDSDRRLNSNTPTRQAQGKDEWQANVFNPITRSKLKAIVASVALQVPQQDFTAVNKEGLYSTRRAELVKQLVTYSRTITNPALDIFFEAWECAGKGTVIKYDGYLKTKYKRKYINNFDVTTGEVEFSEREEIVDDRPIDVDVPLSELLIWSFRIFDIQDQPKIAWVKNYNRDDLEKEFGHYPNFKYVKDKTAAGKFETSRDNYLYDDWQTRVKDNDDYEVIRYYNKLEDRYEIWINGVDILLAPLLWGRKKKYYPFSKSIFEPFSGRDFFYGASLPGLLQGNQDIDNTVWNSILDKLYRSLKKPMLVGLANKDSMDLENELVDQDDKIYVPDISQVKPIPFESIGQGEMGVLQAVSRMLDLQSVDAAGQGIAQQNITARGILVADENARKLKGIFFMFLEDLWLQKTKLRIENVLLNYMKTKKEAIIGKDGAKVFKDILTIYNVKDVPFSDGTTGTLGIQVVPTPEKLPSVTEIEAKEKAMELEGINYKLIAVTEDYIDDWELDFTVSTSSIFSNDKIRKAAEVDEKHSKIAALFPEYFVANKDKLFDELVDVYGESGDSYKQPQPIPAAPVDGDQKTPLQQGAETIMPQ